jgi:hypothetical protein
LTAHDDVRVHSGSSPLAMNLTQLLLVALAAGAASCLDPVHDEAVDALGPERRGVREGPNHRPGQPCRTCHGGLGPASAELAIAGTVYAARGVLEPLAGVTIALTDATGETRRTASNEVGNFFIGAESWSPSFPVTVRLEDVRADDARGKAMETPIRRTGDCATCHHGADGEPTHMPPVYLRDKAL